MGQAALQTARRCTPHNSWELRCGPQGALELYVGIVVGPGTNHIPLRHALKLEPTAELDDELLYRVIPGPTPTLRGCHLRLVQEAREAVASRCEAALRAGLQGPEAAIALTWLLDLGLIKEPPELPAGLPVPTAEHYASLIPDRERPGPRTPFDYQGRRVECTHCQSVGWQRVRHRMGGILATLRRCPVCLGRGWWSEEEHLADVGLRIRTFEE